jgi:hypothetical protein
MLGFQGIPIRPRLSEPISDSEFIAMSPERILEHPKLVDRIFGIVRDTALEPLFDDTTPMRVHSISKREPTTNASATFVALMSAKEPFNQADDGYYIALSTDLIN